MEITPGVHAVALRRVYAYLILEREVTLIDAGLRRSRGLIERALVDRGRSLADVARVVCTHGHPDHAGGARELADLGVEVLMHPADLAGLQVGFRDALRNPSRGRIFAAMTDSPPSATPLVDGTVLPVLGGLEVVHTPGHTPGSVCLYSRRDRLLFVGDVLQRRRGRVTFASSIFSDDVAAARRSVQRLADLDVRTIAFGHYPPVREGAADVLASLARSAAGR